MIYVHIDHSYEDDYFMISEIEVEVDDISEKERIEKLIEENNIVGQLVDGDSGLALRLADLLNVNVSIIDIDTNEIDLY
ncbi:hypothetical protein H9636_18395 [Ureibacillus sp. Re31]|uniref:Uncharacterized protein n=1 Tax=Ureibacillus galli TaxID=2762222 RepID=A0ABR8XHA4_9BACL|nr:hypothetical protein [Ureibacillus galli]MBD8028608.1 hypothetical protein [Ureibacillus galli]